ncbi:MAG: competence/damage-inducible protein A [Nitratireductor sp.]
MTKRIITAAMLAIGDELLSGRTKDKNIGYLADFLTLNAIDLKEVRIVSDEEDSIVAALNDLRAQYDYVFTSGGIGPTHDDITADSTAKAFGVKISHHEGAMHLLAEHYKDRDIEFTSARQRMARVPHGASLIENVVSVAPGFKIENVHVMAGVPSVFQAMLDAVAPALETGIQMLSEAINSPFPEGTISEPLAQIQKNNPNTSIGSYPKYDGSSFTTQIIIRAREESVILKAKEEVLALFDNL